MKTFIGITGALIMAHVSLGQEAFRNLNFESATLSLSVDGGLVPVTSALPDWSAFIGSTEQTQALQNDAAVNAPSIDIFGPNNPNSLIVPNGAPLIIDGHYTVVIQGGATLDGNDNLTFESASLEQTGTIPAGDQSLEFKAWAGPVTAWEISFGGNILPLVNLGTGANYTLYGADISAYAGQTGLLDFTANAQGAPSFLEIDDITFSTTAVPEPSPVVLTGIGGLLFALYRRRLKRPSN